LCFFFYWKCSLYTHGANKAVKSLYCNNILLVYSLPVCKTSNRIGSFSSEDSMYLVLSHVYTPETSLDCVCVCARVSACTRACVHACVRVCDNVIVSPHSPAPPTGFTHPEPGLDGRSSCIQDFQEKLVSALTPGEERGGGSHTNAH